MSLNPPSGMDRYFDYCYPVASSSEPKVYLPNQRVAGWVSQGREIHPKAEDWMNIPDDLKDSIKDCENILKGVRNQFGTYRPTDPMKKVHEDILLDMQGFYNLLIQLSCDLRPPTTVLRQITNTYAIVPFDHIIRGILSCEKAIKTASGSLFKVATSLSKHSEQLVDVPEKDPIRIKRFGNVWQNGWIGTTCIIISALIGLVIGVINVDLQVESLILRKVIQPLDKFKYHSLSVAILGLLVALMNSGNTTPKLCPDHKSYKASNMKKAKEASAQVEVRVLNLMDPMGSMDLYWDGLQDTLGQLREWYTFGQLRNLADTLERHIDEVIELANVIQMAFCIETDANAPLWVHLSKERSRPRPHQMAPAL